MFAAAADIYGWPPNATLGGPIEALNNMTYWLDNPTLYVQRIRAAVDAVSQLPYVNSSAIGLTGYCFGGTGVVFDVLSSSKLSVRAALHT